MIHSPATVLLIVRKCWQHIALVDINLEVLGQLLHVGEGAPDGVEVEDDAPEHHAPHDVSAEADAHHTQDQDLLAEVLDSSQVAAVEMYFDPNPSGKNVKLVITEVEAIEYKLISLITKNSG